MASSVASGTLRDLYDELDRLVAEAYGWTWPEPSTVILERLVTLHDRRVEKERAGTVPWLRPEYQIARFAKSTETDPKAPEREADDGAVIAPSSVRAPLAERCHWSDHRTQHANGDADDRRR